MKLLVIIVVYNPNLASLEENLNPLINSKNVDEIIIWNNSNKIEFQSIQSINKIKLLSTNKNEGLSFAYNFAFTYAKENDFTHLMTMDQDSSWVNLDYYLEQIKSFNKVAVYTANLNSEYKGNIYEVDGCINSGRVVPIEILDKTNGFYTDFFIDAIDAYFERIAKNLGYKFYLIGGCYLIHNLGYCEPIKLFGKKLFTVQNYSPMRLYEIERNHLILLKKFKFSYKDKKRMIFYYCFKMPLYVILGEKNKYNKIKAIIMGIYDGLKNRENRVKLFIN